MNIVAYIEYALGILVAFGTVIFIHEFGHFIVAKKSGIKVEQFSFGFGKEIFGFRWGETRYSVNWIPLGGFVKMAGEMPTDYEGPALEGRSAPLELNDHSRDFMAKPWFVRTAVALAGPVMNYFLAILLFFSIFVIWGEPHQTNKTEIGEVLAGMPAEAAGLMKGDLLVKIENEDVQDFGQIAEIVSKRKDQPTVFVVNRGDKLMSLKITPQWKEKENRALIGIAPAEPKLEYKDVPIITAFKYSLKQVWFISAATLDHLAQKIRAGERPDVAGPLGIGQFIVKAVQSGWRDFLSLIGLISVALGLFNLFPIPLLDGGHVLYYLIEGIRGKPVSTKVMSRANAVGLAFLVGLFVFATFNDITRKLPQSDSSKTESHQETNDVQKPSQP